MKFQLLRYFSIASLLAFVAVAVLLGVFYRNTAVQAMIEQEESKNVAVTQTFANFLKEELTSHLAATEGLAAADLHDHPSVANLRRIIAAERAGLPVAKIKIYNAAGMTIFSTEASQIGEDKSDNEGFLTARGGGVVSELTHRNTFSTFDGVLENQDVLSTYLPIHLNGVDGAIVGVLELYSNMTPLLRRIDATERTLVIGAAGILAVLYFILFLIVRNADGIIRRQHAEQLQVEATLRRQQLALTAARERERLARDLHDSVGQVFGYVNTQAQAASALLAKGQAKEAQGLIQRLVEVVQQTHLEVRQHIHALQAGAAREQELATALDGYVAQLRRRSHLQIELDNVAVLQESKLAPAAETELLGIVQEALTNVHKHAQARHARVCFEREGGHVVVTVSDDGVGFAPNQVALQGGSHFGLRMMGDRAEEIGGTLRVQSAPGRGTQVKVKIPLAFQPQEGGQPL